MKRTTTQNLKLGIFVVCGTVLFIAAIDLLGNRQTFFGNALKISAVFKNVNGLNDGNKVRFSGMGVGRVSDIEMFNDSNIRVNMVLSGEMKQHIKKNAVATIGTDGLVGNMIVNIIPGDGSAPFIESGDEIESYSKIAAEDLLSTLNVTNENAALLTVDLLKITESLVDGKGTLGRLLRDTVMADDLQETMANLRYSSAVASRTIRDLNEMVSGIDMEESVAGVLLADSVSAEKIRTIIANLETSSQSIEETSHNLNALLDEIRRGKGPINYMANDSNFVNSLESTMENIDEGTESFKQNMEALKHNFLFRGYFRRLERQREKAAKKQKGTPNDPY